ncbi:hypothetical protein Clacol_001602 [Clathrus columnatus]|uniref:Uncharacterized protein n=1 Tax=Clathrus columnatus TaxID=1419009 RepID=A0AAV5A324_9AGAM|nr:hypothetical protein Clacol_001602 [Clathrus columnatus]
MASISTQLKLKFASDVLKDKHVLSEDEKKTQQSAQLIPQLIINYKLKSVAHMPMKRYIYRVDPTRVNEYGQVGDTKEDKVETKKNK